MSSSSVDSLEGEPRYVLEDVHIATLVCPFCEKRFTGNRSYSGICSNYRRHLLIHTHERPYKCRYCGAGFTTKPNMRRHIRFVHPLMVDSTYASKDVDHSSVVVSPRTMESAKEGGIEVRNELYNSFLVDGEDIPCPESLVQKTMEQPFSMLGTSLNPYSSQPTLANLGPKYLSPPEDKNNVETCHYCGRCFSWLMIRLLHERRCSRRKGLLAAKIENATEHTSFPNQPPVSVDSQSIDSKVAHCPTSMGSTPSDLLSKSSPLDTIPKPIFVCKDCELEVSSRSKLRRHQQYYCPFRDDAHADLLTDVLVDGDDAGRINPGMVGSNRKVEFTYAHQLTESVGLKFINNANISSSSSESNMYEERYGLALPEEMDEDNGEGKSGEDEFIWAYVSSVDTSSSVSLNCVPEGRSSPKRAKEDTGIEHQRDYGDLLDDCLHLDFKRRRGGNKRARRILLKRMRAKQVQLQVDDRKATWVSENSRSYLIGGGKVDFAQPGTPTESCECHQNDCPTAFNMSTHIFPSVSTSLRSSKKKRRVVSSNGGELRRYGSEDVNKSRDDNVFGMKWSLGLRSRAEALANSTLKRVTHHSYVCPFDGCLGRFSRQKYWLAHAARCHPVEWVQYQKRLRTEEERTRDRG
ncbi:unnamed protein product [Phytomonas sp. Hart1]|nr:unnamed protein product [Phytomonas sp. Hart1]|eukprot:CCW70705.1 unnamed protein product [Phytomonas sp. isolate Hart1]